MITLLQKYNEKAANEFIAYRFSIQTKKSAINNLDLICVDVRFCMRNIPVCILNHNF
jgi:hypothetical protein